MELGKTTMQMDQTVQQAFLFWCRLGWVILHSAVFGHRVTTEVRSVNTTLVGEE